MKEEAEKKFRGIIYEIIGKQIEIDNIASYLTNMLIANIKKNSIFGNGVHDIPMGAVGNNDFKEKTKINKITGFCIFSTSSYNKVTGSFLTKQTKFIKKNLYDISIQLYIKSDYKTIEDLKPKIESVISHELNHAYAYVQKLSKQIQSKTLALNSINKELKIIFEETPALKEFTELFYLNLPEEIQARVQETATALKYINANNTKDTIDQLYQYQPINDAIRMTNYSNENLKILDEEILQNFVNAFNKRARKTIEKHRSCVFGQFTTDCFTSSCVLLDFSTKTEFLQFSADAHLRLFDFNTNL